MLLLSTVPEQELCLIHCGILSTEYCGRHMADAQKHCLVNEQLNERMSTCSMNLHPMTLTKQMGMNFYGAEGF